MPELPDIELYVQALGHFIGGKTIANVFLKSPFVVRTFEPDLHECIDRQVIGFQRLGKRIVWNLEGDLFLVFHLMIAGRFHWRNQVAIPKAKNDLVAFQFEDSLLVMTESSHKKRASIHVVGNQESVESFRPPGLEIDEMTFDQFSDQIGKRNHTLKRCLTDPRLFSGIGNAYSDEILHAAGLSPIKWTLRLTDEERNRLYESTRQILNQWRERLRFQPGDSFPKQVTAFRPEMAVHGKFGQRCPACQTKIQRIRYADRETNYCPRCQTDGKILADRSLSRLLKEDWPKTIEELEDGELENGEFGDGGGNVPTQ